MGPGGRFGMARRFDSGVVCARVVLPLMLSGRTRTVRDPSKEDFA